MKAVFNFFKRLICRFLPGLVLALMLIAGYKLNKAFQLFGTEDVYRQINGFHHAEIALKKTGLWACAYDAANTSLYYDTYARDGESLTVFVVSYNLRDQVSELIAQTEGWHAASVTAQDYAMVADHFRTPASMLRPMDDVVFDAFFYRDLYLANHSVPYSDTRVWNGLPDALGLADLPYTTDYRFAFYDRESGLFICYDETM